MKLYIDNFDTTTIGVLGIVNAEERRFGPSRSWLSDFVPGAIEGALLSQDERLDSRELRIELYLEGTSTANYYARLDELKARLRGNVSSAEKGVVDLEFDDRLGLAYKARLLTVEPSMAFADDPVLSRDIVKVSMELLDPYLREQSESSVGSIVNSDTAIPLGTGPSYPRLRIAGAFTNPTITYKSSGGTTLKTLGLTLTKSGGQWVEIDMRLGTIVDNASANQQGARNSGSDFPWYLDPRDGTYWSSAWPTLRCSSGTLTCYYFKGYE